ncbi:4Fe-4S ferredoxin [Candidatus Falkowbacteria bacterium CG11_big_fil_rev_8_21_14_0_20_39_10]|uniref:Ferredoxin n=1 Tax=Candidatus Falkowbacteria bacterium CG11_big_fil_rev_8_21_14_0_20_39_10 TaxID=1974570 RepID=A0A2M6K8Z7_9BACT|nr:MAG: 4Fe-4S ferredoxin [Candidatus Falkowbacteria bacterium CG11_big_fil_rev_8_21_14_0_20_39_10]
MAITIDKDKCIGCGTCPAVCANNFQMNDDKAEVTSQEDNECVKNAIEACPVQAISLR